MQNFVMKDRIFDLFLRTYNVAPQKIEKISADGSNRQYYRCFSNSHACMGVYNEDRKENEAFLSYAKQLREKGIKVPDIYAEDLDNGVYLQQDLGDTTLFSYLQTHNANEVLEKYKQVIKSLTKIQTIENFDYSKAYPRQAFDMQSIQWDLNYFKYYFLKLAGISFDEEALENDFAVLQNYLLSCDTDYFLYRDFQSRNIMLSDDEVYFIDFQGGRKGALQYDIASLLYDAKANITPETRQNLYDFYLNELRKHIPFDEQDFTDHFHAYIYIRIMQAMGSYGYRGYFEKKVHFLKSIPFALRNLEYLENNVSLPIELPTLHKVFKQLIHSTKLLALNNEQKKLTVTIKSFSYKKGYPHDVSGNGGGFVFDCRALPNPGRLQEFKSLTGMDKPVQDYLKNDEQVVFFLENVEKIVRQSIDNYLQRGFTNLSVYFGCTGGQHRSVYSAEYLAKSLSQNTDLNVIINHIEQNM